MDLNDEVQRYRDQNKDPLGYWVKNLSPEQIVVLDSVKKGFNEYIDWFSQLEKERLELKLDGHISAAAQKEVLLNEHAAIVNQKNYLNHYRDILLPGNLINDNKYNEFAFHFGFLGFGFDEVNELQQIEAQEYLNKVATLNLIDFFLKELEINKDRACKYSNIFTRNGEMLFLSCVQRLDIPHPTTKFTVIYFFLKSKGMLIAHAEMYMQFVRDEFSHLLVNRNGSVKFSRLAFVDYRNHIYTKYESILMDIYHTLF